MQKMYKKGMQIRDLMPVALIIVVTVIAMSIGADVVNSVKGAQTGAAANISNYGLASLEELGSWVPTISLVVAAAIIIGVLVYSFAMRQ